MTTRLTDADQTGTSDKTHDDLTEITGIGPARQKWLRESFSVQTFRDLAALSTDEIESRLKAEGRIASQREIEGWIIQASQLAATGDTQAINADVGERAQAKARGTAWKPFASFVVEFQARKAEDAAEEQRTTVHYMEGDKSKTWPGVEGLRPCQWMLEQVGVKAQPRAETEENSVAQVQPAAPPPAETKVTRLRIFQPPRAVKPVAIATAGRPFRGSLQGDEPFALEVSFDLIGADTGGAAERGSYRAQIRARNLATAATENLGTGEPVTHVKGQRSYKLILPRATLGPGTYRLRVLMTFQDEPMALPRLGMPVLQVI